MLPSDQDSSGRTFGAEELAYLMEAVNSGTLSTTKGKFGKMLEKKFAEALGAKYAYACTSGSAAIHIAVAAVNPNPGDEIVTTSITDMGALTPLMYRGAIPVFAEVDTKTLNVTAETIEKAAEPAHQGDHRHAPLRKPVRDGRRSWSWPASGHPRYRGFRPDLSCKLWR